VQENRCEKIKASSVVPGDTSTRARNCEIAVSEVNASQNHPPQVSFSPCYAQSRFPSFRFIQKKMPLLKAAPLEARGTAFFLASTLA
jgi:hypothetical protein